VTDGAVLCRLLGLARPWRRWMGGAVLVACATVLASVALMGVSGWFIAAMAIAGATTGMMNYFLPAAAIRFFAIVRTGGRYAERLLGHEATFRLLAGLRLWLFRRLEPLAPAGLEDRRGADLAGGLQADVDTLQHAYLRLASPIAVALGCGVATVAAVAALHPPTALALAVLLLAAGGVAPTPARCAGRRDRRIARRAARGHGRPVAGPGRPPRRRRGRAPARSH
jgi:ATP-binding cassette, subfamily C, bacterial CydC